MPGFYACFVLFGVDFVYLFLFPKPRGRGFPGEGSFVGAWQVTDPKKPFEHVDPFFKTLKFFLTRDCFQCHFR